KRMLAFVELPLPVIQFGATSRQILSGCRCETAEWSGWLHAWRGDGNRRQKRRPALLPRCRWLWRRLQLDDDLERTKGYPVAIGKDGARDGPPVDSDRKCSNKLSETRSGGMPGDEADYRRKIAARQTQIAAGHRSNEESAVKYFVGNTAARPAYHLQAYDVRS